MGKFLESKFGITTIQIVPPIISYITFLPKEYNDMKLNDLLDIHALMSFATILIAMYFLVRYIKVIKENLQNQLQLKIEKELFEKEKKDVNLKIENKISCILKILDMEKTTDKLIVGTQTNRRIDFLINCVRNAGVLVNEPKDYLTQTERDLCKKNIDNTKEYVNLLNDDESKKDEK